MTSMNEWMIANGYLAAKETRDGRWAAVAPMLFTHRIIIGPKGSPFVDDAWCYHDAPSALTAFHEWDPDTEPEPQGWHRHPRTGRRRVHGDPATEYVAR